jgi:hypothetical protein
MFWVDCISKPCGTSSMAWAFYRLVAYNNSMTIPGDNLSQPGASETANGATLAAELAASIEARAAPFGRVLTITKLPIPNSSPESLEQSAGMITNVRIMGDTTATWPDGVELTAYEMPEKGEHTLLSDELVKQQILTPENQAGVLELSWGKLQATVALRYRRSPEGAMLVHIFLEQTGGQPDLGQLRQTIALLTESIVHGLATQPQAGEDDPAGLSLRTESSYALNGDIPHWVDGTCTLGDLGVSAADRAIDHDKFMRQFANW